MRLTVKRRAIILTNKNQDFNFLTNVRTDLGQEDRRRDIELRTYGHPLLLNLTKRPKTDF